MLVKKFINGGVEAKVRVVRDLTTAALPDAKSCYSSKASRYKKLRVGALKASVQVPLVVVLKQASLEQHRLGGDKLLQSLRAKLQGDKVGGDEERRGQDEQPQVGHEWSHDHWVWGMPWVDDMMQTEKPAKGQLCRMCMCCFSDNQQGVWPYIYRMPIFFFFDG